MVLPSDIRGCKTKKPTTAAMSIRLKVIRPTLRAVRFVDFFRKKTRLADLEARCANGDMPFARKLCV